MKIVITDAYTLNPGDLSWEPLEKLGELTVYERTPPDQVLPRCAGAAIILTNKVPFTAATLQKLPALRLISVLATGFNVIDTAVARELGIVVCNVPGYGTASVAQHTIALLLELCNQVGLHNADVQGGGWVSAQDWGYAKTPLKELDGKTMGIVGLGSIGSATARIAIALGMKIIFYNRTNTNSSLGRYCSLEELFTTADIVSLHCPLSADNTGFVNRQLLSLMKPTAFLINASRGQLVNEADLSAALNSSTIAGAAVDTLSTEPPKADNPLLQAKNCIVTPHNAWMSQEARARMLDITVQNVRAFLKRDPIHVVN